MITATESFIGGLEKWLAAWKAGDWDGARFQGEQLRNAGQLLAIRPEFGACLEKRLRMQPQEALGTLSAFLVCAAACRQAAEKPNLPEFGEHRSLRLI